MCKSIAVSGLLLTIAVFGGMATSAAPLSEAGLSDLSSQRRETPRARTRIRVTPGKQTGKLVRECDFRLVQEARATGIYVTPQQRCWWTRR